MAEFQLTHTYAAAIHYCEHKNIDVLVLWYLNTGRLPFEEFPEEWLYNGEA